MAANLRERLKRINEQKKCTEPEHEQKSGFDTSVLINKGWQPCGFQTLKRDITIASPLLNNDLPQALAIIVPDLRGRKLPSIEDFVFFDLETSGLSGGAGTVAFLAAFGRQIKKDKMCITQYLLLDYPGENDFVENILKEFENEKSVIVTYNGKSFDSQILKTRCLMNRIKPPVYYHADLLHPARRLWKNIIRDCSQSSIETRILGLDRSGDIPGSLAPEIWFEFLKTGRTERLLGICDHNIADIKGLASILAAMIKIAGDPIDSGYSYDIMRIAMYWRNFCRRNDFYPDSKYSDLQITGKKLFFFVINSVYPDAVKAAALRVLAIDSERKLKCIKEALEFAKRGLKLKNAGDFWQIDFERRVQRLEKKLHKN